MRPRASVRGMRFEGTYTALVTPFRDEPGQPIDWDALDALVEAQIAGGVTGLVPCGTTGESPTLNERERRAVIERVVAVAAGRVPVLAGTGSCTPPRRRSRRPRRRRRGRRRGDGGDALLQQALAGRHAGARPRRRARGLRPDRALQHPRPLGGGPRRRHHGADLAKARNVAGVKDATGNVLAARS